MKRELRVLVASVGLMVITTTQNVFADPNSALNSAKVELQGQATPIVNNVIVPICALILVVITLIAIVKSVVEYRRGAGVDLGHVVILIVGIILVITFPSWGWGLIN